MCSLALAGSACQAWPGTEHPACAHGEPPWAACRPVASSPGTNIAGLPRTPACPARSFLQGLFTLAVDPSPAVRKAVCMGLVAMLIAVPERLQPSMPDLIEYMLKSTQVRAARMRCGGREVPAVRGPSQAQAMQVATVALPPKSPTGAAGRGRGHRSGGLRVLDRLLRERDGQGRAAPLPAPRAASAPQEHGERWGWLADGSRGPGLRVFSLPRGAIAGADAARCAGCVCID